VANQKYLKCYYCSFSSDTDLEDLYLYKPVKGANLKKIVKSDLWQHFQVPYHTWQIVCAVIGKTADRISLECKCCILPTRQIMIHLVGLLHSECVSIFCLVCSIVEMNCYIVPLMDYNVC
jgi:hypothetical protein